MHCENLCYIFNRARVHVTKLQYLHLFCHNFLGMLQEFSWANALDGKKKAI